MGKTSLSLIVLLGTYVGTAALGGASDPNQYDYTRPAREKLFVGTLSGLVEAYQILGNGLDDTRLTGDKRELLFLHALATTGMVVFDRNDAAVTTSLVEILEPFGITVTGNEFFPDNRYDTDRIRVRLPVDPNDPSDCYELPPGANPNAAAAAVNEVIIPEIDAIMAQLDLVTDVPTVFTMTLAPTETGLASDVEVDRGDVLALKAALLAIKTALHGAANPAYDLTIDLADPLFEGLGCGNLPASTTFHAVLDAYPMLFRILPETGADSLGQAKVNLIATLNGAMAALDHIVAETDSQIDDLLQIDEDSPAYATVRNNLNALRDSLLNDAAATYTIGSNETFVLNQVGAAVGQLNLRYRIPGVTGWGSLVFSEPNVAPAATWEIQSFEVEGNSIEGDAEAWDTGSYWAWFGGTISSDGSQITDLAITYRGWPDPEGGVTGLNAQRTDSEILTAEFDPNPLFAGSVGPRDALPRLDANDTPVAGTVGHGLGNDPTLGGVTPGMTQEDWIGTKYAVYGVPDGNALPYNAHFWHDIDQPSDVVTKLGESAGRTATFSGDYPLYIVATQSRLPIDSIYGLGEDHLDANDIIDAVNLPSLNDMWDYTVLASDAILGPPDGHCVTVGDIGLLGQFTGFVLIHNPGTWTGLTVVTDSTSAVGIHRLWSSRYGTHFYTIDEAERDAFLQDGSGGWVYEGIAYWAFADESEPGVNPVHRFSRASLNAYFYTINEMEKNVLIQNYSHMWTYEGVAFYAFPEGQQPPGTAPVHRFWSDTTGTHFYTIDEGEKDRLMSEYAAVWIYEGVAWYAYP